MNVTRTPAGPGRPSEITSALPQQLGVRVAREIGTQQRFQLWLIKHVGLREAVVAVGGVAGEFRKYPQPLIQQPQTQRGPRNRGELVGNAETGDDAVDFVVQVHGAWLGVHAGQRSSTRQSTPYCASSVAAVIAGRSGADDDDRNVPNSTTFTRI